MNLETDVLLKNNLDTLLQIIMAISCMFVTDSTTIIQTAVVLHSEVLH